jgi:hypothetical protein
MPEELHSPDPDDPLPEAAIERRAHRARSEQMHVSLRRTGGLYDVRTASGSTYRVDIAAGSCTCPDWTEREPEGGCKHLRRVRLELDANRVPTPAGTLPEASSVTQPGPSRTVCDGGAPGSVTGPHREFDKHGTPTGETYYRCETCGREAIDRSDLPCVGAAQNSS